MAERLDLPRFELEYRRKTQTGGEKSYHAGSILDVGKKNVKEDARVTNESTSGGGVEVLAKRLPSSQLALSKYGALLA